MKKRDPGPVRMRRRSTWVCPICKKRKGPQRLKNGDLRCRGCGRIYPVPKPEEAENV